MNRLGIGTLAGTWLAAAVALAQDTGDRATSFQAVSGAVHEDVPGGTLLVAAYGVVLAVLVLYVVYLTMMQQGARKDLARLEQVLAGKRAPEGDAKKE